ncbi:MAG: Sulfate transport system permease protein CysW, partial [uncultured Solirubrobacteraceae bacterium]
DRRPPRAARDRAGLPGCAARRPGRARLLPRLRARPRVRVGVRDHAGGPARLLPHLHRGGDLRPAQRDLRRGDGVAARAPPLPGAQAARRARRPPVRGLPSGRRPRPRARVGAGRLAGLRDPGHLLDARHRPRHRLRVAALRGARGRARPARGGHRAGAGRRDARRVGLADLLAHHAADHPLGPRLRRRAHHGPRARRVRRRLDRLGQDRRLDGDDDPLRRAALPGLRPRGGIRRCRRPRRDRHRRARPHDPAATQPGDL